LQPLTRVLAYQTFGHIPVTATDHTYIYGELKEKLKMLNNYLKGKTFMIGKSLTIIDIYLALIELELQQVVLDTNFRNSMSNLNNHFKMVT